MNFTLRYIADLDIPIKRSVDNIFLTLQFIDIYKEELLLSLERECSIFLLLGEIVAEKKEMNMKYLIWLVHDDIGKWFYR